MINVAVLGYGTIGSGVVEVLNINRENIAKRAGKEIQVKYVLDLIRAERDSELFINDLSMPYLEVKFNPELYQTNSKILKLGDLIPREHIIKKSFVFGAIDKRADLFGLRAVLFDLILLRALKKEYSAMFNNYCKYLTQGDMIICETMFLLATKIASAGMGDVFNDELARVVNIAEEYNLFRRREN